MSKVGQSTERERFAGDVIAALQGPSTLVERVPNQFKLTIQRNGKSGVLNLEAAFARYLSLDEANRRELFREIAKRMESMDEHRGPPEDLSSNVLPRVIPVGVRSLGELQLLKSMKDQLGGHGFIEVLQKFRPSTGAPLCEGLSVSLALDREHSVEMLADEVLEQWKVDPVALRVTADENLRRRSLGEWERPADGVFRSPWKDAHDPARMLLIDQISALPVKGRPVAFIPNSNTLVVIGDEDEEALPAAIALVMAEWDEDRPLALRPFVLDGGLWSPWDAEAAQPFVRVQLHREYGIQQKVLEGWSTEFAATYRSIDMNLDDSEFAPGLPSVATWAPIPSLLPRADFLVLVGTRFWVIPRTHGVFRFEAVLKHCAECLERVAGVEPPRWRTLRPPNAQEIDALRGDPTAGL